MAAVLAALCCLLSAAAGGAAAGGGPVARAPCATYAGEWATGRGGATGLAAFRGIKYGTSERFAPPVAGACGGEVNATRDGDVCWQMGGVYAGAEAQSEDCLHLNVFTYELGGGGSRAPVLFWIHGGSLVVGSSTYYGAVENLAERGRAVVVAINYRLNVFGFAALAALSAADPRGVSGNLGFLDQQLALRWVQRNIAAFGGDPGRVTIIGQSSGGTSIVALLSSPASRGLFSAAVSLSASPSVRATLADAEAFNERELLPRTPCANLTGHAAVRECLLGMNATSLLAATPPLYDDSDDYPSSVGGLHWAPLAIVDGVTLPLPAHEALGNATVDVPLILQNEQAEDDIAPKAGVSGLNATALLAFLETNFLPWGRGPALGRRVAAAYAADLGAGAPPPYTYYAVSADTGVTCGTLELAATAAGAFRSNVYASLNRARPDRPFPIADVLRARFPFHMWDYIAAAETWDLLDLDDPYVPAAGDLALGAMFREQWWTLAATGSLESAQPPSAAWRPVNDGVAAPHYVAGEVLDNGTRSVVDLKADICDMWRSVGIDWRFYWIN